MRQIDGVVLAADASGELVRILLGKTPGGGPKVLALRDGRVGIITAIVSDLALDALITRLIEARAVGPGAAYGATVEVADMRGSAIEIKVACTEAGQRDLTIRHSIGTISGVLHDDMLDELIAELQALRAET